MYSSKWLSPLVLLYLARVEIQIQIVLQIEQKYTFCRVICQKSKFKFWYFIYKYDTFYENFHFYFRVCHSLSQYRHSTFNDYRNKKRWSSRQTVKRKAKMFSDWHKALVSKTRNIFLTASTNISLLVYLSLPVLFANDLCTYIMIFQCFDVVA
jgi:hypothetical protein